jgi:hypothetical protein
MIVLVRDDCEIRIPGGHRVVVNGAGDKVVYGYRSPADKEAKLETIMALVGSEGFRYLYMVGDVKIVKQPNGHKPKAVKRANHGSSR